MAAASQLSSFEGSVHDSASFATTAEGSGCGMSTSSSVSRSRSSSSSNSTADEALPRTRHSPDDDCKEEVGAGGNPGSTFEEAQLNTPPSPTSALSRHFAALRHLPSVEARVDASLAEVGDSVLRAMHQSSERYKPSVKLMLKGTPQADRREHVDWLVQAFDVMHFSDVALFDAALVLDRHSANSIDEHVCSSVSQRNLLAAVCLALKLGSREDMQHPLRRVVTHLGREQIPFGDVLDAELAMLGKLNFCVCTPTARDFLEALGARIAHHDGHCCMSLAEFLLQLTLVDPHLHYRYPHCVLAAAVLALAMFATEAPSVAYASLLEDLSLHDHGAESDLVPCCADVHDFWVQCLSKQDATEQQYVQHLCAKFSHANRHRVSRVTPPKRVSLAPLFGSPARE